MAVTTGEFVEGEGSTSNGAARAGRAGAESSRASRGRKKLSVERCTSSRTRQRNPPPPVITLDSSEDEGSGDERGAGHDEGASTRTQQGVPNSSRVRPPGTQAAVSPNFRSAAAMAGWDDEALMMAAVGRGTPDGPTCKDPACEGCSQCRERKRGTRTPGQAATPLSAERRHRRARRGNEEPNHITLVPIPMAELIDPADRHGVTFWRGDGGRLEAGRSVGSYLRSSENTEIKDTKPCVNTTGVKVAAEAAEGNTVMDGSLQLDKLREELTCVVCLDVCFEPSTTSCGHSFCRGCLHSVYVKCGMRCPKCRQALRTTRNNDCPINTVLWNTIQLLFPQETAAPLKDQKSSREQDSRMLADSARTAETDSQHRLGLVRRRITRPVPWRDLGTASRGTEQLLGGPSMNLRWRGRGIQTSFRRASETLESAQPASDSQNRGRRLNHSGIQRQEEEDAALAARLQESFISEAGMAGMENPYMAEWEHRFRSAEP